MNNIGGNADVYCSVERREKPKVLQTKKRKRKHEQEDHEEEDIYELPSWSSKSQVACGVEHEITLCVIFH